MDQRILKEIEGISVGSGLDITAVQQAQMVDVMKTYPTYSSGSVAAWGGATGLPSVMGISRPLLHAYSYNGTSLQTGGPQDRRVVVLYIPKDGFPHAIFTSAGLVHSHVGVNIAGVSIAEIADGNDSLLTNEQHFLFAERAILYDANSLREGVLKVRSLLPTRAHHYLLGDGRFELRGAKVRRNSQGFATWLADDPNDEYSPQVLPELLYSVMPNYVDSTFSSLYSYYGNLDDDYIEELTKALRAPGQNVMNVVINNTAFSARVAYGDGTNDASTQPYVTFDFQSELP